jgi:hypothetical protein
MHVGTEDGIVFDGQDIGLNAVLRDDFGIH